MRVHWRHLVSVVAVAVTVTACSASGTSTGTPHGGASATPPSGASQGGPTGSTSAVTTAGAPAASQSTPGGAAYPADPCALLTTAEVIGVTSLPVAAGDSAGDNHKCGWVATNGQTLVLDNVGPGQCDSGSSSALGLTVTKVSGVGDTACWIVLSGLPTNLTFYSRGLGFTITVTGAAISDAQAEAMERSLALDLLAGL